MKKLFIIKSLEEYHKFLHLPENDSDLLLLKISSRCTVSFIIQKIFENWFNGITSSAHLSCGIVEVNSAREVSDQIEKDFLIKHESPQAIWLTKELKVKWRGSHHKITPEALQNCLTSV